jgi:hypothetical protein
VIAALYVETGGCYYGLPDVDPWDEARDARLYAGPWPCVAHPPCQRWGRFWFGGTHPTSKRYQKGDDGGCFEAAIAAVRQWGGVLEHPADSYAWRHMHLNVPPKAGGWVVADWQGGWTCHVEQGAYGHESRKPTWLYANGVELPSLKWGRAPGLFKHLRALSAARMLERGITEPVETVRRGDCEATPIPFRDLLLSIARSASARKAAA